MSATDIAKEVVRIVNTHGLAKDVIDLLEKKLALIVQENATLTTKVSRLEIENSQLRAQIQHTHPVKQLSDDQRKILELLNSDTTDHYIDFEFIAGRVGLDLPKARFVLDQLTKLEYLWDTSYSPPSYRISPKGREFLYETSA
ncbi:MAG: hypothetical protein HZA89_03485 [Verrucomicrobia bacterium]|nr:hypothetical protein [Verrucomicrobiota bacterium]